MDGQVISDAKVKIEKIRAKMGMVFQQFNLFPHYTVLENIVHAPMVVKHETRDVATKHAKELLRQVGLAEKKLIVILYHYLVDSNSGLLLHEPWQWNQKLCSLMNRPAPLTLKW